MNLEKELLLTKFTQLKTHLEKSLIVHYELKTELTRLYQKLKKFLMIVPENAKLKGKLNSLEMVGKLKENHGLMVFVSRKGTIYFRKK